jgi:hypothetical protein
MATSSWNAGIIRPVAVAPAGPYQDGAAPGVWTIDQAAFWVQQGLWPIAGNLAPTGLFGGGNSGTNSNVIDKINIASVGNATDFGDLTVARRDIAACASSVRGVWAGGRNGADYNVIDYVSFASAGNALDFGDLLAQTGKLSGCSNYVRGVFGGGALAGTLPTQLITLQLHLLVMQRILGI